MDRRDWSQRGQDIDGEGTGHLSGFSVSLSGNGNFVAIGAPRNEENGYRSGHVRIFSWNGQAWSRLGSIF